MESESIKVGAVVRLKSGGPDMTVESVDDDGEILCTWFQGADALSRSFRAEALKKAESASSRVGTMVL